MFTKYKQGFMGGTMMAIFSSVTISGLSEHFWTTLLTTLAFTMLCVIAVT